MHVTLSAWKPQTGFLFRPRNRECRMNFQIKSLAGGGVKLDGNHGPQAAPIGQSGQRL
jgi:hypothetical protein